MTTASLDTLSFDQLRNANRERCGKAYHSVNDWSPSDWGNAMAGEFGEVAVEFLDLQSLLIKFFQKIQACDTIKKIMRQLDDDDEIAKLQGRLALELADVVIYADLLAERLGIDLGAAVRTKFNEVSDRRNIDIRL